MSKQDRQGVRTPAQLEQKYRLGETLPKSSETQSKQGSQISQLSQTLAVFMASTNAALEALLSAGGACNAFVGTASGNTVVLNDVSPLVHTMTVKLLSDTVTDFEKVEVSRYGETEEDGAEIYTPNAEGVVAGVKSLYPITTLKTNTEGVVIEVTYNRDVNKVFAVG